MKDAEDYNFKYDYEKEDPEDDEDEELEINEDMVDLEGNVIQQKSDS